MSSTTIPSAPVLSWQHSLNNAVANSGTILTDQRALMRGIKTQLIGFGSLPWSVKGSCDSTTAGMDNTDRWSADNKVVWANAGTAHSWIVLGQNGLNTGFQLCIDCNTHASTAAIFDLVFSVSAGFTGGTTTARPTATDEAVPNSNYFWAYGTNTQAQQLLYNVSQSTDGTSTRIYAFYNNFNVMFARFDKLSPAETGVTIPVDISWVGSANLTSDSATYANLCKTAGAGKARPAGSTVSTGLFTLGGGTAMKTAGEWGTGASPYSGYWIVTDFTCWDITNAAPLGKVQDLYFGSSSRLSADNYPSGGTKVWGHVGNVIVPTGGTLLTKT